MSLALMYIIIPTELVFSYLHFHLFYRYLPHRFFICNSVLKVIFYFIFFPSSIFTSYFLFTLDVFAKGWSKTSHITNIWFCWSYLHLFCSSSDGNLSSLLVYQHWDPFLHCCFMVVDRHPPRLLDYVLVPGGQNI